MAFNVNVTAGENVTDFVKEIRSVPDGMRYIYSPAGNRLWQGNKAANVTQEITDDPELLAHVQKRRDEEEKKNNPPPPTAASPAPPEAIADTNTAMAVYTTPDVCKTPIGTSVVPIPYPVYGLAGDDSNYSKDVFLNGYAAMRFDSAHSRTYGDEPGLARGQKSNTVGDIVEPTSHSTVLRINGSYSIRHNDSCTLNNGNCTGEFIHVKDRTAYAPPDTDESESKKPEDNRSEWGKFWDGMSGNASETWDGVKSSAAGAWDGTKNLATNVWNDPAGMAKGGISNVKDGVVGGIEYADGTLTNLFDDPAATLGRGRDNVLNTGAAIWHASTDGIVKAYGSGGIAEATGYGLVGAGKFVGAALTTKGLGGIAGRTAAIGNKAEEAVAAAKTADKLGDATDDAKTLHKAEQHKTGTDKPEHDGDGKVKGQTEDGDEGARITAPPKRKIPCFELPPGMSAKEMDRQLAEQMSVINNMTGDDMAYAMWVRDKAGGTKNLRNGSSQQGHRNNYKKYLLDQGWDRDEIEKHMEGLQATHMLDMVAGGDPLVFSRDVHGNPVLGQGDVNEQIGRQWIKKDEGGTRKADHLRDEADKMRKSGRHKEKMNVELERCK